MYTNDRNSSRYLIVVSEERRCSLLGSIQSIRRSTLGLQEHASLIFITVGSSIDSLFCIISQRSFALRYIRVARMSYRTKDHRRQRSFDYLPTWEENCVYYYRRSSIALHSFLFCRFRFTKPQTFADCIGNELPLGWEEAYDKHVGAYYINHVNRKFLFRFCYLIGEDARDMRRRISLVSVRIYLGSYVARSTLHHNAHVNLYVYLGGSRADDLDIDVAKILDD